MQPTTTNQPNSTQTGTDTAYLAPPPGGLGQASTDQQAAIAAVSATPTPIAPTGTAPAPVTQKVNFQVPTLPTYNGSTDITQFGLDAMSPEKLANFQSDALTKLMNDQAAAQTDVFKQYADASNSQETATDRYSRLSDQYGLPIYQKQMQSIQGLLDRLSENVTSRVQGTFTTQAQRDRMEAVENKDLNTQLGAIGRYASSAQENISTVMGLMSQDDQKQLEPIKTFLSTLGETFGRQLTGAQSVNSTQTQGLQGALGERAAQLQREAEAAQRQSDEAYRQATLALQRQQLAQSQLNIPAASSAASGGGTGGAAPNYWGNPQQWTSLVNQLAGTKGATWSSVAQQIEARYGKIPTGSLADQALHTFFNNQTNNTAKGAINNAIGWKY